MNVMNVVKILTNSYNLPPFQESVVGITKSLVLGDYPEVLLIHTAE